MKLLRNTMRLQLNGIDVECVIGERPDERDREQRLRVDLTLEIVAEAADTDELADTVDYAELIEKIRQTLISAKCCMIERAAKMAAKVCAANAKVLSVESRVTKFGAIAHLESATAVYSISK